MPISDKFGSELHAIIAPPSARRASRGCRFFDGTLETIDREARTITVAPNVGEDGSELVGRHTIPPCSHCAGCPPYLSVWPQGTTCGTHNLDAD